LFRYLPKIIICYFLIFYLAKFFLINFHTLFVFIFIFFWGLWSYWLFWFVWTQMVWSQSESTKQLSLLINLLITYLWYKKMKTLKYKILISFRVINNIKVTSLVLFILYKRVLTWYFYYLNQKCNILRWY